MKNSTRARRRHLRRNAKKVAFILACATQCRTPDGRLSFLTDPVALAAVERGFCAMLCANCKPVVQEISATEGDRLRDPGNLPPPPFPGVRHWAAFGLDVEGRATFVTNWALIQGLPEAEVRNESERLILQRLAEAANTAGLPVGASS